MTDVRSVAVQLRALSRRAGSVGAPAAARAMGQLGVRAVAQELMQSSHPRGTPTPSMPGQPPALVSGTMARSVRATPPTPGPKSETTVGASTQYSRIHELGGASGLGHRTILPPRPYLKPAIARLIASGEARRVAVEAFRKALAE